MNERIKKFYENLSLVVDEANACDKAHAIGTGNENWYKLFDENSPEKVAVNLAGIVAVISGVQLIREYRELNLDNVENMDNILNSIIDEDLDGFEEYCLLLLANTTRNTCQPFRDITSKPLGRIKNMNVFDYLPKQEVEKDWHQIKAAAKFLLEMQ
jgi:hypothetical protein